MSWTFYTASGVAKTAEYIGSEFPIGTVVQTTGLTAPSGWKICDGSALSRTTYSDLYATIGTTYGSGNGSTTFNIPDASGKMIYVLSLATRMTTGTLAPATGDLTGTYPSLTIPSGTITADKIADSNVTTAKLAKGATSATYVTSLPSSPVDGQEIYYAADATNGVIWHLRYRAASSSSYKWEFVGGSPIERTAAGQNLPNNTSEWIDATTVGPKYDVALAGDYLVHAQANGYASSGPLGLSVGVAKGANIPVVGQYAEAAGAYAYVSVTAFGVVTGATTDIRMRYNQSAPNSYISGRRMLITPVRVG